MTILEAMQEAYLLATGKTILPLSGSTKYARLYGLCVKFHRDFAYEKGVDWNSLNTLVSAGPITATDTFDLDSDTKVIRLSQRDGDYIRLTSGTTIFDYGNTSASNLYQGRFNRTVAKVGQTIRFSRPFVATDQEMGGTLLVPAYVELEPITSVSDEVLIDNPAWLPVVVAAQYVLSDAQLSYQYPDLVAQATELMDGMKLDNLPQDNTYTSGTNYFANAFDYGDGYGGESY